MYNNYYYLIWPAQANSLSVSGKRYYVKQHTLNSENYPCYLLLNDVGNKESNYNGK